MLLTVLDLHQSHQVFQLHRKYNARYCVFPEDAEPIRVAKRNFIEGFNGRLFSRVSARVSLYKYAISDMAYRHIQSKYRCESLRSMQEKIARESIIATQGISLLCLLSQTHGMSYML